MALKFLNDGFFDGKVGIGETAPTEKFVVNGSVNSINQSADFAAGPYRAVMDIQSNLKLVRIGSIKGAVTPTGDEGEVAFYVNNFEKVRIDKDGQVGIGTTNPTSELHVEGADNANLLITRLGVNKVLLGDSGSNNGGDLLLYNSTGVLKTSIRSDANSYLIGGNVGIGTTSPPQKLTVNGAALITSNLISPGNIGTYTYNAAAIDYRNNGTRLWSWGNATTRGSFSFIQLESDGQNQQTALTINSDGNVGIGTDNPIASYDRTLHVKGVNPTVKIETNSNDGWAYNQYKSPQSIWSTGIEAFDKFVITNSEDLNTNIRFCIDDLNGNVGIGTSTPLYKLHVNSNDSSDDVTFIHHNNPSQGSGNVLRILSDAGDNTGSGLLNIGNGTGKAMYVRGDRRVGIGTNSPDAGLSVKGLLSLALSGTITISNSSNAVTGTNTAFLTELKILDAIKIGAEIFTVSAIGSNTSLTLDSNVSVASTNVTAFIDPRLLSVRNGDSRAEAVIDKSGNFSVGDISNDPEQTTNGIPKFQVKTATAVLGEFPLAARFTTAVDAGDNSGVSVLINSGNDRGLMISAGRQNGNTAKASLNIVGSDGVEIETLTLLQKNSGGTTANVGIGTTTPAAKLHVKAENPILLIQDNSTATTNASSTLRLAESDAAGDADYYWDIKQAPDAVGTNLQINHSTLGNALTVLSTGNVGIGETNPNALLHVRAANNVTGTIEVQGGKATVTGAGEVNSELNFGSNDASATGGIGGSIKSVTENTNGAYVGMSFYTAKQGRTPVLEEAMRIDHDGNVGIGEGDPTEKFVVNGSVNSINQSASFATGPYRATMDIQSSIKLVRIGSVKGAVTPTGDEGEVAFFVNSVEKARIDKDGSVGIGTTNPGNKLQVAAGNGAVQAWFGDTSYVSAAIRIGGSNEEGGRVYIQYDGDNSYIDAYGGHGSTQRYRDLTVGARNIIFSTETAGGEKMRIASDGNVGIGTTNPLHKLSIESASATLLKIKNTTSGGGAAIEFNDNPAADIPQNGKITYYHSDSASQGGGSSYWLTGEDDQTLVLANNGRMVVQKTGSSTKVGYGFYDDVNTGMYHIGADNLGFATGGSNRLNITNALATFSGDLTVNGDVGIGTTNPTAPLQVVGIAEYTNNTTALAAGLTAGAFYRTGDLLKVVH